MGETTESTGTTINTSKDIEEKISQLEADETSTKLEKILKDFDELKMENRELEMAIKKANIGF